MFTVIYSRAFLPSYFIIIEIEKLIFFEAKSHHTTQGSFELIIPLPYPPEDWNYSPVSLFLA